MLQWRVGDVTITKIVELEVSGGSRRLLPAVTPDWLEPYLIGDESCLRLSIHSFVIETPHRRILVDTCVGNDKQRRPVAYWNHRQGSFLADLAEAGFPPDSIDTVVNTHLHIDHVGWNTTLRDGAWVPTFANARYLIARNEFAHWRDHGTRDDTRQMLADSVQPILDAGQAELVEPGYQLCEEVELTPTIGHTPGHISVHIASCGQEALITGDFMHHPCQIAHPEFELTSDSDPAQGVRTRREVFERIADRPVLVLISHFAGATGGFISRDGERFRFDP